MITFVSTAQEILDELYTPDVTLPVITTWLRNNLGKLNGIIGTEYAINSTTLELTTEMDEFDKAIFKKMYICFYYTKKVEYNLGATAYEKVLSMDSDGGRIVMINKNEIAKTYLQLKKQCSDELSAMVNEKKLNPTNSMPLAVHGDDGNVIVINNVPNYYVRLNNPT